MSNDIKVGDLVYVARPAECCGSTKRLGIVFTVARVEMAEAQCSFCRRLFKALRADSNLKFVGSSFWPDVNRLEKFRDFPESELREVSKELESQS